MADNSCETEALLRRAREGGSDALGELILRYSGRLRAMVDLLAACPRLEVRVVSGLRPGAVRAALAGDDAAGGTVLRSV